MPPRFDSIHYEAWARVQQAAAAKRAKSHYKTRRGPKGPAPFPVGVQIRYGATGVPHEVIAARAGECDARAPSGNISTVVRKAAHLWQEVT